MENTVANSLAAWLTFDQLSCKFENIRGSVTLPHAPIGTSLATNRSGPIASGKTAYFKVICCFDVSIMFALRFAVFVVFFPAAPPPKLNWIVDNSWSWRILARIGISGGLKKFSIRFLLENADMLLFVSSGFRPKSRPLCNSFGCFLLERLQ